MQNKVKTLGILAIKKEQRIGQRAMSYKIIDITIVRGLQQFDQYNKLNPIEIKIDRNKIVADLAKYQKLKCRFSVDGILFSSAMIRAQY